MAPFLASSRRAAPLAAGVTLLLVAAAVVGGYRYVTQPASSSVAALPAPAPSTRADAHPPCAGASGAADSAVLLCKRPVATATSPLAR